MGDIDFNVKNYSIDELIAILDFNDIPLNDGKIKNQINILKSKFSKDKRYETFFNDAEKRLTKYYNDYNKETWQLSYEHDNSEASKVLTKQFQYKTPDQSKQNESLIIDKHKHIIGHEKLPLDQTFQKKDNVQGNRNPILRNSIKRIINFDSHYRQILDASSCRCSDTSNSVCGEANGEIRLYTSTNYTVNLNESLINVVDLTLDSVEIPNSWYVFSSDYGTNKIKFTSFTPEGDTPDPSLNWQTLRIEIPDGNYQATELENALNVVPPFDTQTKIWIDDDVVPIANPSLIYGLDNIHFSYNSINGKFTITNLNTYFDIKAIFYSSDDVSDACPSIKAGFGKVGNGGKIDYNLGWLLGFRVAEQLVDNSGNKYITGRSPLDNYGPKYFLISLDDFNNNKPNKNLISLIENETHTFKLPKYLNSQTMDPRFGLGKYYPGYKDISGYECIDVANVNNNARGCFEGALNIDLSSNLTKKQKYTIEQIQLARDEKGVDRYFSPNTSDLLGRIPINRVVGDYNNPIIYKNENPETTKRKYFGPVKLRKFNVKLLNDKGFEVNLHDRDWSMNIIVTQLYQY